MNANDVVSDQKTDLMRRQLPKKCHHKDPQGLMGPYRQRKEEQTQKQEEVVTIL